MLKASFGMEKICTFAASNKENVLLTFWGSRIVAIATDCKSVRESVRWFESTLPHKSSGSSSFGRAKAFQALGGGFEPRLPLRWTNKPM